MNSTLAPLLLPDSSSSNPLKKPWMYSRRTGVRYASAVDDVARGTALIWGESEDEMEMCSKPISLATLATASSWSGKVKEWMRQMARQCMPWS